MLVKTTNGVVTKYVYGLGLIGEESECTFKTYHYDYRGSTVAITDACGEITDTLEYDSYGEHLIHRGNTEVIFGYNGRDGVITENTDLLYMRSRYFSKQLMRFINADILHGDITDSQSLNRYAYVNGNPVSYVDPLGLSKEERGSIENNSLKSIIEQIKKWFSNTFGVASTVGSDYDAFSWNTFFGDIETGISLNKEYKGKYKPVEFISEISSENNILDIKGGVKVNFNEESGFKITFGFGKLSFESANKDSFFEFIVEPNKVGITVSNEIDWKDYSVGDYISYYIRPQSMALAAVAAVGVVTSVYFTKGAIIPVFAAV